MKYEDVSCPDELVDVVCQSCKAPLVWNTEWDVSSKFPMDVTAEASCCGRIIHAYINSIHIYDTSEGE